jgi:Heterokaryon incompatibility protein (HET)
MQECTVRHGEVCELPVWYQRHEPIPDGFRLIDVRNSCLVKGSVAQDYFALSYVWGTSDTEFRTTKEQLEELFYPGSIDFGALPSTITDAARLVLELSGGAKCFLWVDRICIVQDDQSDKAVQIPLMDTIYAKAKLTIIAASGRSIHDGLTGFGDKRRNAKQSIIRISSSLSLTEIAMKNASYHSCKWRTRGWTFQERVCSRRTLVITDDQIYWSCRRSDWCERLHLELPSQLVPEVHAEVNRGRLGCYEPWESYSSLDFGSNHFRLLLNKYLDLDLTNEADILDAFAGITRRVSKVTRLGFHWGHCRNARFDESLAWFSPTGVRREALYSLRDEHGEVYQVQFPSWSWAGWKGVVHPFQALDLSLSARSELEFYQVSTEGALRKLSTVHTGRHCEVDMADVSNVLAASWKGPRDVNAEPPNSQIPFRDSGRLAFWTSHMSVRLGLDTKGGQKLWTVYTVDDGLIGQVNVQSLPQTILDAAPLSLIIVSRIYHEDTNFRGRILRARPRLNVLLIWWSDASRRIAERMGVGQVDEDAWVRFERDWIFVTLK